MDLDGRRRVVWLLSLAGALAMSASLVLVGLSSNRVRAAADVASPQAEVNSIIAQPRGYLFKSVVVRGEVMRIWGEHLVALRSRPVRQGLLIVLRAQDVAAAGLHVGQTVEVAGSVRPMCRQEVQALRHELGFDMGGDSLLATFSGDPYILAQEVRPASEQ